MVLNRMWSPSRLTKITDVLGLSIGVGGGQEDAEMGAVEDVADGLVEERMVEIGHTCFDSRAGSEESRDRADSFPEPRQRAAFLLCDVLAQPGSGAAAAMLDVSIPALKSLLQRARSS